MPEKSTLKNIENFYKKNKFKWVVELKDEALPGKRRFWRVIHPCKVEEEADAKLADMRRIYEKRPTYKFRKVEL